MKTKNAYTGFYTGDTPPLIYRALSAYPTDMPIDCEVDGHEMHIFAVGIAAHIVLPLHYLFRFRLDTAGEVLAFLQGKYEATPITADKKWRCCRLSAVHEDWNSHSCPESTLQAQVYTQNLYGDLCADIQILWRKCGKACAFAAVLKTADEELIAALPPKEHLL